jgi:hypothetical protein
MRRRVFFEASLLLRCHLLRDLVPFGSLCSLVDQARGGASGE